MSVEMSHTFATLLLTITIISIIYGEVSTLGDENPEVQISSGPIVGKKTTSSWTDQTFYAFLGVPYAAPPVGDLRFKDPQPAKNWTTTLDCTGERSSCLQPSDIFTKAVDSVVGMSEDCLFLNVYTPQAPGGGSHLLPVLVWMHGGAFMCGSGNYSGAGFDYFLAEGIVVVTMNYRLGAFGFLTLGTSEVAGNYGLKDQRFALLWVRSEIEKFGGDPAQVTLFGESSGSASVHLHYLSPLSVGLFHRTIADSGTALVAWAARDDAAVYGLALSKSAGCSTTNLTAAAECLRAQDAVTLLQIQSLVQPASQDATRLMDLEFTPAVDYWSNEPFLPEMPFYLMQQDQGSSVPFVMGTNRDEGVLDLFYGENAILNITNNLEKFIPVYVKNNCSATRQESLAEQINEFYLNCTIPSYYNIEGFLNLNTDAWFSYSTAVSARCLQARADVYLYYFTFNGTFKQPLFEEVADMLNITLISHAEEMNYLGVVDGVNQTTTDNSKEDITRKRMVRMWTNFVKYGIKAEDSVTFELNGKLHKVSNLPANTSLLQYIRDVARLRGTKFMCREGGCGACVVDLTFTDPATTIEQSVSINSCLFPVYACQGMTVTTVEGIGSRQEGYHPVQTRLAHFYGSQCGFCSPGWVMAMYSLIKSKKDLTEKEIEDSFGSNQCRCTGYRSILDAFKSFAKDATVPFQERIQDIEVMKPK